MLWLEEYDCCLAVATNVGSMHSGFAPGSAPFGLFCSVLLNALKRFLELRPGRNASGAPAHNSKL